MTVGLSFYSVKTPSLDTRVENNETFQSTKGSTKFNADSKKKKTQERQKKCRGGEKKEKIGGYPF